MRPSFHRAFANFSLGKVAGFSEKDVKTLMGNPAIVRNEKKIRAAVHNAAEFLKLQKEFGSFQKSIDSFGKTRSDCSMSFKTNSSM